MRLERFGETFVPFEDATDASVGNQEAPDPWYAIIEFVKRHPWSTLAELEKEASAIGVKAQTINGLLYRMYRSGYLQREKMESAGGRLVFAYDVTGKEYDDRRLRLLEAIQRTPGASASQLRTHQPWAKSLAEVERFAEFWVRSGHVVKRHVKQSNQNTADCYWHVTQADSAPHSVPRIRSCIEKILLLIDERGPIDRKGIKVRLEGVATENTIWQALHRGVRKGVLVSIAEDGEEPRYARGCQSRSKNVPNRAAKVYQLG